MNSSFLGRVVRGSCVLAVAATLLVGCKHETPKLDYTHELAPGEVALRKLDPSEYPDFSQQMTNPAMLIRSCDASMKYLMAPSSQKYYPYLDITHDRALASVNALKALITKYQTGFDGAAFNSDVKSMFEVYISKGAPNPDAPGWSEKVLFTGYFTPIYNASLTRFGPYQYPLYKRPADLVVDPATGDVRGRKAADGSVAPYYTRAQIEGGNVLAGQELCWVTSRWEAYVITIQGSARLRLPDGQTMEVGFSGFNGYDYTSPGSQMLADGVITKDQYSLQGLRRYFAAHPTDMDKYLWLNKRYVFFTQTTGGPFGSLGVPVTPRASIAVDKKTDPKKNIYPRAMPAFLTVPEPADETGRTVDFRGFMMDQDTGGAIRAAGRCDIYMGIGEAAEKVAGFQFHEGQLYYIALRNELVQQFLPVQAPKAARPAVAP